MNNFVNTEELEKLLLVNWTKFINPQRMISLILSKVRDVDLPKTDQLLTTKKSVQVTLSQFRPTKNGNYSIWADFIIPKQEGIAVGTCELFFDPFTGSIDHLQTLGNMFPV